MTREQKRVYFRRFYLELKLFLASVGIDLYISEMYHHDGGYSAYIRMFEKVDLLDGMVIELYQLSQKKDVNFHFKQVKDKHTEIRLWV